MKDTNTCNNSELWKGGAPSILSPETSTAPRVAYPAPLCLTTHDYTCMCAGTLCYEMLAATQPASLPRNQLPPGKGNHVLRPKCACPLLLSPQQGLMSPVQQRAHDCVALQCS